MSRLGPLIALIFLGGCDAPAMRVANGVPEGTIVFDAYLWQAARQTVKFLPTETADPIGGVLETDWGPTRNGGNDDRYKVRIEIDYSQIYSRALAVTVRHQVSGIDGWREVDQEGIAALQLAKTIGDEAGELRLGQNRSN